jgi:carbonic anhydrase
MFDNLLAANESFAAGFDGSHLVREPVLKLVVVTCMDARIDTLAVMGLKPGDAHVLRNAGGRVSDDVIRSLLVSTRLLGVTRVVVMHHTGCGMATISKHGVREIAQDIAEEQWATFDLLEIGDQKDALREDVAAVHRSPLLPDLEVAGFIYDVATGRIERLV